jgi:hypothetical protein
VNGYLEIKAKAWRGDWRVPSDAVATLWLRWAEAS